MTKYLKTKEGSIEDVAKQMQNKENTNIFYKYENHKKSTKTYENQQTSIKIHENQRKSAPKRSQTYFLFEKSLLKLEIWDLLEVAI